MGPLPAAHAHLRHLAITSLPRGEQSAILQDGFSYLNHPSPESHHKVKTGSQGYREQEVRITEPTRGPAAPTVLPTQWSSITKCQFTFITVDFICIFVIILKSVLKDQSLSPWVRVS